MQITPDRMFEYSTGIIEDSIQINIRIQALYTLHGFTRI